MSLCIRDRNKFQSEFKKRKDDGSQQDKNVNMSLARYPPRSLKKPRLANSCRKLKLIKKYSFDELDDHCILKIIGYTLEHATKDQPVKQNMEMELSLVNKRWYLLTQIASQHHAICHIELDKWRQRQACPIPKQMNQPAIGIPLYNKILGEIRKYEQIHIEGSMALDEFRRLALALGATRTENIEFRLKIEKESSSAPLDFCSIHRHKHGLILDSTIDRLENVRGMLDYFHHLRHRTCQLILYMRDQKVSDCEDKIKKLALLSRTADVTIHITAISRISIDCCHLMWSVGRYIQQSQTGQSVKKRDSILNRHESRCLFRICVQVGNSTKNWFELIVPFGKFELDKIYPAREDLTKHRDILKSVKKACYNSFVKSLRDHTSS